MTTLQRLASFVPAGAATFALAASGAAELPHSMQAMAIDKAGGPLTLHTLPLPKPAPNEVLVEVHFAGVAIWDVTLQQHPEFITHSSFPFVLGTDGAGVVVALGSQVQGFKLGQRVYGGGWDDPNGGFYAEYVAVPEDRLGHLPSGLSLRELAAIYGTGATALQGIDDQLRLQSGQTLIIHGAAGGVGSMAIQFAKLRGARVLATASGEDGLAFVKKLGADAVVDGRRGNIAASAHDFAPVGVDAVLGLAGGEALERCIDAVRPGGRVAFPWGVEPKPKARADVTITGYDLGYGAPAFASFDRAVRAAKLQVPIAAEYPLADAQQAHERQAAGHVLGKILLRVR
jgi:NADPH2:quinone reductase